MEEGIYQKPNQRQNLFEIDVNSLSAEERAQVIERIRRAVSLEFGGPGHELEYVLTMPYHKGGGIADDVVEIIHNSLPSEDWEIMDRGTRIEIRSKENFGKRNDDELRSLLEDALKEKNRDLVII